MISIEPAPLLLRALTLTEGIEEVGGPNAGRAVELIQASTGNKRGDPWCASFVYRVGSTMLGKDWPLPCTGGCDELLRYARKNNMLTDTPQAGDVFLVLKSDTDAVHTGFVVSVNKNGSWGTMEGNSNPNGGREGYGVFRRTRGGKSDAALGASHKYGFVRWIK